jgi:MFS transporter, FSR family, fosmidomycin resistance protein
MKPVLTGYPRMNDMARFRSNRLFWAVSLGHAANDMFMSMRAVLFTFISTYILPMSSAHIGLGISVIELTGALGQPFFGWFADKTGGRWLGALGVAWTMSLMLTGLLAVSLGGSYWLMLIPMALAGLGSAAFHPVGSMHATDVDPMRAGRNAAVFFMFGQLGLAIGPTLAGVLLNNAHSQLNSAFAAPLTPALLHLLPEQGSVLPIFVLGLLVIPAVVLMAISLPNQKTYIGKRPGKVESAASKTPAAPLPWKTFGILALAVALRSPVGLGAVSFMPLVFQLKGWSPAEYGLITSSFWLASGTAGVWFGHLADRFGTRRVIMWSLVLGAPCIFFLPGLDGLLAFALAIGIGISGGSHSLIVVLAQRLMPGRKGFASGAILGFIFATGALGNLVMGSLIDRFGVGGAYQIAAVVTLTGSVLWLLIPTEKPVHVIPEEAQPQSVAVAAE